MIGSDAGLISVGSNKDGRLQVVTIDRDTYVMKTTWQTNPNGSWSPWQNLGGTRSTSFHSFPHSVLRTSVGNLEFYGERNDARGIVRIVPDIAW